MLLQQHSVAIIGTGISGLACAYFLARNKHYNVTLFEKENRIGGHSHTVIVEEEMRPLFKLAPGNKGQGASGVQTRGLHEALENASTGATMPLASAAEFQKRSIPVDTGFMVYNEVTYPLLTRLFQELGVATQPTTMSFSVQHRGDDLEYNGASLDLLFAQRRNLFRPRYWRMLGQIARFHKESLEELEHPRFGEMPLRDYVAARGYGEDFLQWYLSPMAAAVWSSPPEQIEEFPARTLLRFWHNHGFMGRHTHHPWRTVTGGSRAYVEKLSASFQHKIHQGAAINNIRTTPQSVQINFQDGTCSHFDKVVLAVHGDQTFPLLANPIPLEQELLPSFRYQNNEVYLHTDPQFMPKRRRAWASWNYRIDCNDKKEKHYSTHYWMNELQGVSEKQNYFVSVNPPIIPEEKFLKRHLRYEHPLFNVEAIAAQERLPELHAAGKETRRYFCGAWQRYGFHEDGLLSAVRVCQEILGHDPWSLL